MKIYILRATVLMFLVMSASVLHAEEITIASMGEDKTYPIISTGSVLEHNSRLMEQTTIGSALKASTNQQVIDLYKEANSLFHKAKKAHKSGKDNKARKLALRSIHKIYDADRVYYNLIIPPSH